MALINHNETPRVMQLSLWNDVKDDDLWRCTYDVPCAIWFASGPMELTGLSGPISAGIDLDPVLFSGGTAKYGWGYTICKPLGTNNHATTSLAINGVTTPFSDEAPDCPATTKVIHNGTWDLGSDRRIWINMTSPFGGYDIDQSTIHIGHPILEVNPIDRSELVQLQTNSVSSSTSLTTTATNASVASHSFATVSGSSASLSTSNSGSDGSTLQLQSAFSSLSSSPISSSSISMGGAATGSNLENDPSKSMQSKLPGIVGGTAAGICVLVIAILLLWRSRRRRRMDKEAQVEPLYTDGYPGDNKEWMPYTINSAPTLSSGQGILYSGNKNRPPSSAPPPAHSQEALMGGLEYTPTTPTSEGHGNAIVPSSDLRLTQPNASGSNPPISPVTTAGGLPAYDTYMDAPLVTFRRARMHYNTVVRDGNVVDDLLHRWAERCRDFVPPHLETRLRAGGYVPGSNPSDLAEEAWLTRFEVTRQELAGLQELYDRGNSLTVL